MSFHDTKFDLIKVLLINIAGLGITFTGIEIFLKVLTLVLTIGYTIWKWRKDYLKDKAKKNAEKTSV